MSACRPCDLDEYLRGELDPRSDAAIAEHVRTCERCAHELAWLRAEHRAFTRRRRDRRSALPDFDGVLARAAAPQAPERRARVEAIARAALGMCAAAALLAVVRQPGTLLPAAEPRMVSVGAAPAGPRREAEDEAFADAPLASEERPRMACLDTDDAVTDEPLATATPRPHMEDEYGACLVVSPAPVCDAPQL